MDILNQLNSSQRDAVTYMEGPHLVIAGAGSGKTRVLTYKIAYLMSQGLLPWQILALTFTNKAANEMKARIGQLVGSGANQLNMGTFHSVFSRILRSESKSIGFNPQFTIYDETDSRSLIKNIIKELGLDDKIYKASTVHNRISVAKNNVELPDDYARCGTYVQRDRDSRMPETVNIYRMYQQRLHLANAMDFDDLLLYTYLLFRDHDDVRRKYSERFRYVLVDEYQDTNSVQQKILLQIVRGHHNVCVVGDDAQSIYGFRGANIDNILDFQSHFPESSGSNGARLFKLEQNYRSTQTIVSAANSLISHNRRQIPKAVFSENDKGEKLQLKQAYSDREEAAIVCSDIKQIKRREDCHYSDFAILYRTNAQSRTFEEQMRKDNIPYRIFGGLSFYQRKEIKDVIAYLRLVINPYDEEALRRIINYPTRGIGNTTIEKVMKHSRMLNVSPWDVILQPAVTGLDVSKAVVSKLSAFTTMINGFRDVLDSSDAFELGSRIIKESGVSNDIYSGTDPDDISRQENLQELISSLQDFVDSQLEESGKEHIYLPDFLQEVSLMSDLDSDDGSDDKVVLMTIHSAKGLEFQTVFVVGMEENIFPSPMCAESPRQLEEERRLLYVAITRAEKRCILTNAQSRYRYGRMEFDSPSRFLREIDGQYLSTYTPSASSDIFKTPFSSGRYQNSKPVTSQFRADPEPRMTSRFTRSGSRLVSLGKHQDTTTRPSSPYAGNSDAKVGSAPVSAGGLTAGSKIEHERFGVGTVLKVEGNGDNRKAVVEFKYAGTKQLLLKFARFKVL